MKQSIVDVPEQTEHNQYNLEQLFELPAGKALKTELSIGTNPRTARGIVWNYCKRHNVKCSVRIERENNHYNMYAWIIS